MGMTMAEKIISRAAGKNKVVPGDYVVVKLDRVMVFGERIGALSVEGAPSRWPDDIKLDKVFDPDRVVVINDHVIPPDNEAMAEEYAYSRKGVKKLGLQHFYDIGRGGICHQVFCEEGFALPGELVAGSDSHTCTYGAFNVAARGVNDELPYILSTGETWMRVPPSIKVEVEGKLPPGVFSKDIALYISGTYGTDFALYKSLEFSGSAIADLSVGSRMTISNMGIELGAKFALFGADQKLVDYVKERTQEPFEPVFADEDASYERVIKVDAGQLQPLVACPHDVGKVKPAREVAGTKIDQAFLGSCTNARYEDLVLASRMLQGKKIHPEVRLIVTPASEKIYRQALETGIFEIFHDANAVITNSTCGACAGLHLGVLAPHEVCIGSQNRNFRGRMGSNQAEVYLGSPATVIASAIEGSICDPGKYL